MIQLVATNLHFLGDDDKSKRHDCCLHGDVLFVIDDTVIEDGGEWCVSASAIRFMRSVLQDHISGQEEHMIPCCGHFMIPDEDGKSVQINGCVNGVDFDVFHEEGHIIIKTAEGKSFCVNFEEYREAVLLFAKQIELFMRNAPARIFSSDFERNGFNAFRNEWFLLKERINALNQPKYEILEINFLDYISISEQDISDVSANGILLKDGKLIHFKTCAYNYQKMNGGNGNCVGERDISSLTFAFYTAPLTTHIHFLKKNKIVEFCKGKPTYRRFYALQQKIFAFGYSTVDLNK